MNCPYCKKQIRYLGTDLFTCDTCHIMLPAKHWIAYIDTRKALDKGMEHITGLNNMIESWYKLLQSDKDTSTKYAILKSAISAYVENKGGDNE